MFKSIRQMCKLSTIALFTGCAHCSSDYPKRQNEKQTCLRLFACLLPGLFVHVCVFEEGRDKTGREHLRTDRGRRRRERKRELQPGLKLKLCCHGRDLYKSSTVSREIPSAEYIADSAVSTACSSSPKFGTTQLARCADGIVR